MVTSEEAAITRPAILALITASLVSLNAAATEISSSVNTDALADKKRTKLEFYLTPNDAYHALQQDPAIIFIDVRGPAEINFVGHPAYVDAIVPLMTMTLKFDAKRQAYRLKPNPAFVTEVDRAISRAGSDKSTPIFVICRSGAHSAFAANLLAKAGYKNVWSLVEGFEGDKNAETGMRDRNGWRNAGLPWTYRIRPEIAYPIEN